MICGILLAVLCFSPQPQWVYVTSGVASWYSRESSGLTTASGAPMRDDAHICAMRWLPFGTRLRVKNVENGRVAYCDLLDRGPYYGSRVLDVSPAVRDDLGMGGLANVVVYREVLY